MHILKKIIENVHPLLFTLDSLLFFYMMAKREVAPIEMLRPLLVLLMLVLALYPLARKIAGNGWTGILLTLFVFGFYFHKDYFVIVGILVAAVVLLLLFSLALIKRKFRDFYLSLSLTLIGFSLLIIQCTILLGWFSVIPRSYYQTMAARAETLSIPLSEPTSGVKPDIYYIVLDNYPGADVLMEFSGYDNSAFLAYLKDLGFIVPEAVYSNYPRTALSISSTLDMQYWDSIAPHMENVPYWWPVKPVLNHSRARASLESIGYQSISIASDWEIANNMTTDYYFKPFPIVLTEYEDYIITSTALKLLHKPFQGIAPVRTNEVHRRFTLYSLEMLTKIPEIPGPKFVFVHIIPPHQPFVFRADGSPIDSNAGFGFGWPLGVSEEEYRLSFVEQVEYINSQLRSVIETILDKSAQPPIILLQSDHGSAMSISFDSIEVGCLQERFSTFGAYYLPGKESDVLPQDLTTVNLFRIVFNEYFGTDLDLLENHMYFTKGFNLFAGMQEVTRQVMSSCTIPDVGK